MNRTQPPTSIVDAYRVLGVQNGEDLEAVKSAYKRLALTTHPDKNPDNEGATQEFQQISEAYRLLAAHLDKSSRQDECTHPFDQFDDDDDYDGDEGCYAFVDLEFHLSMFEEIFRGHRQFPMRNRHFYPYHSYGNYDYRNYIPRHYRHQKYSGETRFEPGYSRGANSSPTETQEQAAARLAEETARAKERMRQQRENEMKDAASRQKEKAKRKREKAQQDRHTAARVLASQREKMQVLRSEVFAAARIGDASTVKRGVWEQDVDPSGGEIKPGCDHLVREKPTDPCETLLHIAARHGDKDLLEWLGSHSGDMEERTAESHTAFHVALKHGHIPVLKYFFDVYPTSGEDAKEIYSLPGPSSLLSLAVESRVPEVVWIILDSKLFQRKEIVDVWTDLSSPAGTAAFLNDTEQKNVKSPAKEVFGEVINLIMNFGGFTRPPIPPIHDPEGSPDSIPPQKSSSYSGSRPVQGVPSPIQTQTHTRVENQTEQLHQRKPKRDASGQSTSEIRPEMSQDARGGRGRGRGHGRGCGRGLGRP